MPLTNLQKLRLTIADKEKVKTDETIGVGDGTRNRWRLEMQPIKNDIDYIHAAITLPESGTTAVTTNITSPTIPQIVTVTGNAAGIAGNVVIVGTDSDDDAATDTIVAAGTATVNGTQEFKTVTSITVPVRNASGDTIEVGINSTIITVNDVEKTPGTDYSLDFSTGLLTFLSSKTPADTHVILALVYSFYAFSDVELGDILDDESDVILMAAARCYRILAGDAARFFIWWSGDEKVDKSKVSSNLLKVAESLEEKNRTTPYSGTEYWEVVLDDFGDIENIDETEYLDDGVG